MIFLYVSKNVIFALSLKSYVMKKFLSLIIAVIFSLGLNAQVSLNEAVDFTALDHNGNEIHLFEILEGGQYVLLHINTRTNNETATVTPCMVEAYQALGCNQHEVFFMCVSPNGTANTTQQWIDDYGIEYPMIDNEAHEGYTAGVDIWMSYQCQFPTTALIAPDKSIALDDIYPIESASVIIDALADFGIEEHACGGDPDPDPTAEQYRIKDTATNQYIHIFNNSANPAGPIGGVGVNAYSESNAQIFTIEDAGNGNVYLRSADGYYIVCRQWNVDACSSTEKSALNMVENGEGTFYLTDPNFVDNKENNYFKVQYVEGAYYVFCDAPVGDAATWVLESVEDEPQEAGTSVIDLEVEVLSETSVRIIATPNAETVVYHYIVIAKADADEIGEEETMQLLHDDEYPLTAIDDWTWEGLAPATTYYAIAQGQNRNNEWGEITKVEFTTIGDGIVEFADNTFKIYPNPATSVINITSELNGETEINFFDMTGRCVKNIIVNDIKETTINIEDLEKGVYFINVNGKVEKLIVNN